MRGLIEVAECKHARWHGYLAFLPAIWVLNSSVREHRNDKVQTESVQMNRPTAERMRISLRDRIIASTNVVVARQFR